MYSEQEKQKLRPWQPAWWYTDAERWRWAATAAVIMLLVGVFTYQNPQLWQEEQLQAEVPLQQIIAEVPEPPPAEIPENQPPEQQEQPPLRPATQIEVTPGMEQLAAAVAVSAAPESWLQPLNGSRQRGYGFGFDATCSDYRFHSGVDYAALPGSKVQAMAAGTVAEISEDALWGGMVMLEHGGGWQTIYKGLVVQVKMGQQLEAGEVLGAVMDFAAESAQDSHVHVEMHLEGECVDPEAWL